MVFTTFIGSKNFCRSIKLRGQYENLERQARIEWDRQRTSPSRLRPKFF